MRRYLFLPFFCLVLIFSFSVSHAQSAENLQEDLDNWAVKYLEGHKSKLQDDTLGRKGIKLEVTERLLKEEYDFRGKPFSLIKHFYGKPDQEILVTSSNKLLSHEEWSLRYVLYKPKGTSTTGMLYLVVDCDRQFRILEFWIFKVDE